MRHYTIPKPSGILTCVSSVSVFIIFPIWSFTFISFPFKKKHNLSYLNSFDFFSREFFSVGRLFDRCSAFKTFKNRLRVECKEKRIEAQEYWAPMCLSDSNSEQFPIIPYNQNQLERICRWDSRERCTPALLKSMNCGFGWWAGASGGSLKFDYYCFIIRPVLFFSASHIAMWLVWRSSSRLYVISSLQI